MNETTRKAKPSPRRRRGRVILIAVLVMAVLFLFWFFTRTKTIEVTVITVGTGLVEQTIANTRAGTVKACRRAKLSTNIGGQIITLPIDEGDSVKAGQLLLELWNQDLVAQVELVKNEVMAAKNRKTASCAQARLSQTSLARLKPLAASGVVSNQNFDEMAAANKMHQADCQGAQDAVNMQGSHLKVAEASLARTRLFAPFDGVIAEISAELNEYVTPSPIGIQTPPAVDLIANNCFYVTAPIDEVDAPKAAIDLPVRISLDAFSNQHFEGTVRRIAAYVLDFEKQARTVDVEVKFTNPEDHGKLLAGYSADVEIIIEAHEDTLRVPSEAVLENNTVWHYRDGQVALRDVKLGLANWDFTEILEGLAAGDKIVLSIDREGLQDGAEVKGIESSDAND